MVQCLTLTALQQVASNGSLVIPLAFYQQLTMQTKQVPDKVKNKILSVQNSYVLLNVLSDDEPFNSTCTTLYSSYQ